MEGGAPRRLPRLQPERQGPHDLLRLLRAPAARRARLDAAPLGRGPRLRAGRLHRADDARALRRDRRSARRHGRRAGSLDTLLELAARDEAAGLGDAPWPPHFRKMEGEAPRVAPSRARRGEETRAKKPRTKMPLLVVANSPDKERRSPVSNAGRASIPKSPRISRSTTCWSTRCAAGRRPGRASA